MPKLQLQAITRRVSCSDPLDREEQTQVLDQLGNVLRSIDRAQFRGACECLDGAMLLLTYMAHMGDVGGREILEIIERLLRSAHDALLDPDGATNATVMTPGRGHVIASNGSDGAAVLEDMLLGEVMLKRGMILSDHIDDALRVSQAARIQFGQALVKIGAATPDQVEEGLKYQDHCRRLAHGDTGSRTTGPLDVAGGAPGSGLRLQSDGPSAGGPSAGAGADADVDPNDKLRLISEILLGDLMVQNEIITQDQLEVALRDQRATGLRLGEMLVSLGYATWPDVDYGIQLQTQQRRNAS